MEFLAIVGVAIVGLGFAGTAVGLAVRNGSLESAVGRARQARDKAESERATTRDEFDRYQRRVELQLEGLRDEITDLQDLLATCSDPLIVHKRLDGMLQKASSGHGSPSPD